MTDTPETRLVINLEARLAEYEKAIEEQFKPALQAAIVEVLSETLDQFLSEPVPGITMTMDEA